MRCSALFAALLPTACTAVIPDDASPLVQFSKARTLNGTNVTDIILELLSQLQVVQALADDAMENYGSTEPLSVDRRSLAEGPTENHGDNRPMPVDGRTFNCTDSERRRMSLSDTTVIADAVKGIIDGKPIPKPCFQVTGHNTVYDQKCLAELTGVSLQCAQCHTLFSSELPACLGNLYCSNVLLGGFMSACAGVLQNIIPSQYCLNTLGSCMACVKPTVRHHYDCKGGYPPEAYTWMDEAQANFTDGSILKPGRFGEFVSRLKKMIEGKV